MNAVRESVNEVVDVAILSALDYHVFIDVSGSTSKASTRLKGKSRLFEMKEEAQRIASEAGRFDSDGITLTTFGAAIRTVDSVTADKVDTVFMEVHSGGGTPLGEAIREGYKKASSSQKNYVGFVFTDGEASDEEDVLRAVQEAAKATGGRPKFGLVIIQVGDDVGATAFLNRLDNEMSRLNVPDMIATVKEENSEGLTFGQLVWLAQNA